MDLCRNPEDKFCSRLQKIISRGRHRWEARNPDPPFARICPRYRRRCDNHNLRILVFPLPTYSHSNEYAYLPESLALSVLESPNRSAPLLLALLSPRLLCRPYQTRNSNLARL